MAKAGISEAAASGVGSAMLERTSSERRAEFSQSVVNRAVALFQSGQLDSADVLLETMEQELAVRPRVLHIRGIIALYRGEDEKALDFLEETIRLEPGNAEAHANLGVLLLKAQQFPQALAAYAAALSTQPGNAAARFGLARALAGSDMPDLAIDAFRDVLAVSPGHAEAEAELVSLLESAQAAARPDNEVADRVMAIALHMTALPRVAGAVLCDALFVEACRHHRDGDLERSKRYFEQVLMIDSAHVNTLCNLGAIELHLGDVPRALTLLQSAVMLAPELAPARVVLADAQMAGGKVEQAHAQYRKALELDSGSDAAHARYAIALHARGDLDDAMMHFLAATKINQHQSSQFYEALGRTCAARGNPQGAEISLKHALELDPQRISAHCALGDLYMAIARPADAETAFDRALAIDSDNPAASRGIEHARCAHPREARGAS